MTPEEIKKNKFWAGCILYDVAAKRVLLQKRDAIAPVNPNLWAFFGGVGETGETPEDCVVREVAEEIGATIDRKTLVPLQDYLSAKHETWRFTFVAPFNLERSQLVLGEGADFDWVPLDIVLEYELTENTRKDLEFFISKQL